MTDSEARKIVVILATAFPTPSWTVDTMELYAKMLGDLDFGACNGAVHSWICERTQRPTIADIRDATRAQLQAAATIPGDLDPDQAWGYVVRCFTTVGRYRVFPRDDQPLVAEVVDRFGWETLCNSDNPEADRAHFLKLYTAAFERARRERLSAPSLRLPDDVAQLARKEAQAVGAAFKAIALPPPQDRARMAANFRELRERIGRTPPGPASRDQPSDVSDPPRPPTADELRGVEKQRLALQPQRAQMTMRRGGGDA